MKGNMSEYVRLLVGFSAGSASNFVAHSIRPALSESLQQTVRIERIQGESGAIFAESLMRSAPDGLVMHHSLFTTQLATRKVCIGGITTRPDTNLMLQMG